MTAKERALSAAAVAFGVPVAMILSGERKRSISHARWAAMWLLRRIPKFSFPRIGELLGMDHSSVIHGIKALDNLALLDEKTSQKLANAWDNYQKRRKYWTPEIQAQAVEMAQAGVSIEKIAAEIDRPASTTFYNLRRAGFYQARPRGCPKGTKADPAGSAFSDDFKECDEKWAALLDGQRFTSLNIPQKPMVVLEPEGA